MIGPYQSFDLVIFFKKKFKISTNDFFKKVPMELENYMGP